MPVIPNWRVFLDLRTSWWRPHGAVRIGKMPAKKLARELRWRPIPELIEEIHEGDPSVRRDWPRAWWGLEPLDTKRDDWQMRYAAVFQLKDGDSTSMVDGVGVHYEDHKESKDLVRVAVRGGAASVAMRYGNGVLQLIAAVVLARLLEPEDFGLVAIVMVLTSFAPLLVDFWPRRRYNTKKQSAQASFLATALING